MRKLTTKLRAVITLTLVVGLLALFVSPWAVAGLLIIGAYLWITLTS